MSGLSLHHVHCVFAPPRLPPVHALSDLSLDLRSGECLALLGPSGSGKTTTLRLIAGLENPTSGEIRIEGLSQSGVPPERRPVALVFQDHPLLPHLDVARNLRLILDLRRTPRPEQERLLQEAARWLELTPLLARLPESLSAGERQRVALATAFVRQPRILLLDEPFAHLDAPLRARLRSDLRRLRHALGWTTLLVTHDQHEAAVVGDRIAVLRQGTLSQCDTLDRLRDAPADAFVATFVGQPPMNLFHGRLERHPHGASFRSEAGWGWSLPETTPLPAVHNSESVLLGVRPAHLYLGPASSPLPGNPTSPPAPIATLDAVDATDERGRLLELRLDGTMVFVRPNADPAFVPPQPGTSVTLLPDPHALHWFHATTRQRLA